MSTTRTLDGKVEDSHDDLKYEDLKPEMFQRRVMRYSRVYSYSV